MNKDELAIAIQADPFRARRELDPRYFIEKHLWIYNKDGKLVPFILNNIQVEIYNEILGFWQRKEPVRLIILKARRFGVSTLMASLLLHASLYSPGAEIKIQSYDLASANYLFGMLQNMFSHLDIPEKPEPRRNAAGELSFYQPHGGRITTESGRKQETGRAFQLRAFHASEVAFWESAEQIMLGVSSALSETDPNSIAVMESTANGVGGYFYRKYQEAMAGKAGAYRAMFLAWHSFDEYTAKAPEGFSKKDLTKREREIMEVHGLDLDRMFWYQNILKDKCDGREELRAQEYPSDDEEAFMASGACRFKATVLVKLPISPAFVEGCLTYDLGNSGRIEKARFERRDQGYLRIWERPQKDTPYVMGVDPSEGVGEDESAIIVLNALNFMQAAELLGKFEPDEELGVLVYMLGLMYNKAYTAIEINGPGNSTQSRVLSLGYPWNRLYTQQDVLRGTNQNTVKRFGWRTSSLTRELAINRFASSIEADEVGVRSERWAAQLKTFVGTPSGQGLKYQGQRGYRDDLVMAGAIASFLLSDPRSAVSVKKVTGFNEDDDDDEKRGRREDKRSVSWSSYR